MVRILVCNLFLLLSLSVAGQAQKDYYASAEGLMKERLKLALHDIIRTHKVVEYGGGAGKTWSVFYECDRMPDGQVRDRYTNPSMNKYFFAAGSSAANASAPSTGINIEHSMANSWWGKTKNDAYKDVHHLYPCEAGINSTKANFAMGLVTSNVRGNGYTLVGKGPGADGKTIDMWEPDDEWKGDFARAYFYMATCYYDLPWQSNAMDQMEQNAWPTLQKWTYELMLQWSEKDPVSDIERERHEVIYGRQGNRNPFIDHPELAEYIWGSKMTEAWTANAGGGEDTNGVDDNFGSPVDAEQAVFTINGVYVGRDVPAAKGVYIVRHGKHAYKVTNR